MFKTESAFLTPTNHAIHRELCQSELEVRLPWETLLQTETVKDAT